MSPLTGQVQVKVSHCGVYGGYLHIFHGKMYRRVKMPQVIGHEMSVTVVALGEGVTAFAPGDRVTVRSLDRIVLHAGRGTATSART